MKNEKPYYVPFKEQMHLQENTLFDLDLGMS